MAPIHNRLIHPSSKDQRSAKLKIGALDVFPDPENLAHHNSSIGKQKQNLPKPVTFGKNKYPRSSNTFSSGFLRPIGTFDEDVLSPDIDSKERHGKVIKSKKAALENSERLDSSNDKYEYETNLEDEERAPKSRIPLNSSSRLPLQQIPSDNIIKSFQKTPGAFSPKPIPAGKARVAYAFSLPRPPNTDRVDKDKYAGNRSSGDAREFDIFRDQLSSPDEGGISNQSQEEEVEEVKEVAPARRLADAADAWTGKPRHATTAAKEDSSKQLGSSKRKLTAKRKWGNKERSSSFSSSEADSDSDYYRSAKATKLALNRIRMDDSQSADDDEETPINPPKIQRTLTTSKVSSDTTFAEEQPTSKSLRQVETSDQPKHSSGSLFHDANLKQSRPTDEFR